VLWGRTPLGRIASAGIGALLALAALLGGAGAQAAFPGKPGLVAFDSSGSIWTVSPTQHGSATKLGIGIEPAFSPSGKLIAFVKGGGKLMVMRVDGGGERVVFAAANGTNLGEPCFSADGKTIFFTLDTSGEGYSDIYSVPVGGGGPTRLTHSGSKRSEVASGFADAAANRRFVAFQQNGSVMTMRPDGSKLKMLTKGLLPSISPNSKEVVVQRFEKLAIVGAGGGHERVLDLFPEKKHPGELIREASAPAFSPDGRSIVFTLRKTTDAGPHLHDTKRLEVYSLSTGKVRQLTGPAIGGSRPDWQPLP
jgi:Tol biopolymer transport system component